MIDANYQGIIDMALNGSFNTFGPVVLNHELGELIRVESRRVETRRVESLPHRSVLV
jgi:hypothetical protein